MIIFQGTQYLVLSFLSGGEYIAFFSFDIIFHSCVMLCVKKNLVHRF
jgi:hypothetical protein